MLNVSCPDCRSHFSAEPRGHWIWCPACGAPIDVTVVICTAAFGPPAEPGEVDKDTYLLVTPRLRFPLLG